MDGGRYAEYIDWRADHPSDDLMTDLLNAEFEDATGTVRRLSRDEILNYIGLLAAAGNETTTRLIGWAGKVLAEHPDQRRELAEDPGSFPAPSRSCCATSPLHRSRPATSPVTWSTTGQRCPRAACCCLMNGAANRDERKFDDPDRFDIHRTQQQHLAFGYGIHFCLGSHLARLEGRDRARRGPARFPDWEIDWDNAVQAHTSTVRGWESLPVSVG